MSRPPRITWNQSMGRCASAMLADTEILPGKVGAFMARSVQDAA
jgi:hypothetical protein